jgi:hypothetical protein
LHGPTAEKFRCADGTGTGIGCARNLDGGFGVRANNDWKRFRRTVGLPEAVVIRVTAPYACIYCNARSWEHGKAGGWYKACDPAHDDREEREKRRKTKGNAAEAPYLAVSLFFSPAL